MPKRDQHGNLVMVGRLVDENPSRFSFDECLKAWFIVLDVSLLENGAVPGIVSVVDSKGVNVSHLTRMSLSSLKKYYMYIQVQVSNNSHTRKKVKAVPQHATKALAGRGSIPPTHSRPRH
jgi:hypothetical protein